MCGHVGMAGSMNRKDVDAFGDLLYFDTVRGPHSTGIAAIERNNKVNLLKRVGPAYELMEHKMYDRVVSMGNQVFIGHNRYATVGKINAANAHPFEFDKIIGAHNGTIPHSDRSAIIDGSKFDTDSEGIFNMINDLGPEMTIPALHGAWALVWYNKEDHTMNFLRNDQRELYYTFSESGQTIYWASEAAMLHAALMRRGVDYGKMIAFRPDVHYIFDVPDKFGGVFEEPQCNNLAGKKEPVRPQYEGYPSSGAYGYTFGRGAAPFKETTTPASQNKQDERKEEVKDDLPFGGTTASASKEWWASPATRTHNKGRKDERNIPILLCYQNESMNETQFKHTTKETCANCDSIVNFKAVHDGDDKIRFINKRQFLCEQCGDDEWVTDWFIEDQNRSVH